MDYKKIFRNRKTRLYILQLLSWIPDIWMIRLQYWIHTGRRLHLKNPKRYTEKIQHYKCFYRNPIMWHCVDKYEVRSYLQERGLEKYLNVIYGVFDSVYDIDFDKLPSQFVVKTTDGGGNTEVYICKENNKKNREEIVRRFGNFANREKKSPGREYAYYGIKRTRIIIEKLLVNAMNPDNGVDDYKFICCNGRVLCIVQDVDRNILHRRNFYDCQWNNLHVGSDCPPINREVEPPGNLKEMIELAEKLASEFPHVRVDLYNVNNQIVFGELTFYPWSGYVQFTPDSFDFELGDKFVINY